MRRPKGGLQALQVLSYFFCALGRPGAAENSDQGATPRAPEIKASPADHANKPPPPGEEKTWRSTAAGSEVWIKTQGMAAGLSEREEQLLIHAFGALPRGTALLYEVLPNGGSGEKWGVGAVTSKGDLKLCRRVDTHNVLWAINGKTIATFRGRAVTFADSDSGKPVVVWGEYHQLAPKLSVEDRHLLTAVFDIVENRVALYVSGPSGGDPGSTRAHVGVGALKGEKLAFVTTDHCKTIQNAVTGKATIADKRLKDTLGCQSNAE